MGRRVAWFEMAEGGGLGGEGVLRGEEMYDAGMMGVAAGSGGLVVTDH
jgi:hypothetical protein